MLEFVSQSAILWSVNNASVFQSMKSSDGAFTASALANAARCTTAALRSWRTRNALFPETAGAITWNRYTFLQVCLVRVLVVLIKHGISPADAIWFVRDGNLEIAVKAAIDDYGMSTLIEFGRSFGKEHPQFQLYVDPEETVGSLGPVRTWSSRERRRGTARP